MLDLFTSPEQWVEARSRVDVFKFYSGQVGSDGWSCDVNPSQVCGDNYLQNFIDVQAFSKLHAGLGLDQNQPNPFDSRTSIRYHVPTPSRVRLKLYDESGREVQTLLDDRRRPGEYSIDVGVGDLPSGIYFYRLKVGALPAKTKTKKMVIVP